jgi:hypothetical protein
VPKRVAQLVEAHRRQARPGERGAEAGAHGVLGEHVTGLVHEHVDLVPAVRVAPQLVSAAAESPTATQTLTNPSQPGSPSSSVGVLPRRGSPLDSRLRVGGLGERPPDPTARDQPSER